MIDSANELQKLFPSFVFMLCALGVKAYGTLILTHKLNQTDLVLDPGVAVKEVLVG